ncbi:MAG TPA: hypothetical protein VFS21_11880 [Roseiflexaceae bacterium]|nr:hypothetical protein [Roseiflexaceae bacterium]
MYSIRHIQQHAGELMQRLGRHAVEIDRMERDEDLPGADAKP